MPRWECAGSQEAATFANPLRGACSPGAASRSGRSNGPTLSGPHDIAQAHCLQLMIEGVAAQWHQGDHERGHCFQAMADDSQ
jgi:hypothetical protein